MKATESFKAVKPGEIYPVEVKIGDDVPEELVETAKALGVVEDQKAKK